MLAAWTRHRRTRNAGVVDLLWAAGLGSLAIGYALLASGWLPRRILVASMAGAWSLRLTLHLAARLRREPEDGRYGTLREKLASRHDRWMLGFFQAQAVLAVVLSLAFLVPISAEDVGFGLRDLAGVLIWVLALGGEALADRQLRTWRVEPRNEGRTCRAGLWRYSRHPNYFFEWMHWLSYPVLSMGLSLGWAVWFAPALMLLLVLKVTGIPPTEEQALRKRGADYRSYQETTNAFFPGPSRARSKDAPQPS
ncbi:MAG: DUF1295 domain-containing protein [Planctomycetes bacterium]|nr:DUF1295 domain-containing protein [Planctomycetota bacterium]